MMIPRFSVILADPPWHYRFARSTSRRVETHYPTLSLVEMMALAVAQLAADDAVLLLWSTAPKLPEAIALLGAWDFDYKTCGVWDKVRIGTGYWFRNEHELLLVAARGHPRLPPPSERQRSVHRESRRREHSAKPAWAHLYAERYWSDLPKLELFARAKRPGWSVWGLEVESDPIVSIVLGVPGGRTEGGPAAPPPSDRQVDLAPNAGVSP